MPDEVTGFYDDKLNEAKGEKPFPGMGEPAFQREKREDTTQQGGPNDQTAKVEDESDTKTSETETK